MVAVISQSQYSRRVKTNQTTFMTSSVVLPSLSNFQNDWLNGHGTDSFNPNSLGLEAALNFMRSYTQDR
jgi:hypothetical protein